MLEKIRPSNEKGLLKINLQQAVIINVKFQQKSLSECRTRNDTPQTQPAHVMSTPPPTSTSYCEARLSLPV